MFAYNHDDSDVNSVLTPSLAFGDDPEVDGAVVAELQFAAGQIGTPYRWGGTGAGGFDCSGLSQAALAHAGVTIPRVAQDQFAAGPPLAGGATVRPGDLVFFGSGPAAVDHVGLYVGSGLMVETPSPERSRRLELPFSFQTAAA